MFDTSTLRSLLPPTERLGEMGLRLLVTFVVAFVLVRLLFLVTKRIERLIERARRSPHSTQRARTLGRVLKSTIAVLIGAAALIHALDILGWDVGPLLAGAGVLGVAIGFGAQTLIRDVISGLFILAEDQFGVGDVIELSGVPATVEDIAVRTTTLRDGEGYVHYVPNGEIRSVTNRSRGWNRATADVILAPDEDVDRALDVCRKVVEAFNNDKTWRDRLLDPAEVWGIESLSYDGIRLRISARTLPGADSALTGRELRRRVHRALLEAGITVGSRLERVARRES